MNILFYSKSSTGAVFIWPALAINFNQGFWIELAWLSFAIGIRAMEDET